jgi:cation transport regulator ChaC
MNLLFGYGSLLSPASASTTLRRQLAIADFRCASIVGYRRTWTAAANVQVATGSGYESKRALFLDLSPSNDSICNGALIEITDDELTQLDIRERQYERVVVQAHLPTSSVSAFTYMVPTATKSTNGIVLARYLALVREGLTNYPSDFRHCFWSSTDTPPGPLIDGSYTFSDAQQNSAAGYK